MGLSLSSFLKLFEKKKNTFEKQNNPTHTNSNPIATPGLLTLDISSQHVQLYSASPENISNDALRVAAEVMTPGNDLPHTPFIRLLSGTLAEFLQYSGADASRWLINTAHDLCDPKHRRGSLYILRGEEWVLVVDADPLTASQYLYHLGPGVTVGLSKISRRAGRSRTSTIGNASTMANHVMQRDGKCWVTRARRILINSHICPKRMGDHTARNILRTFTTLDPSADVSIFDEIFGLNLISYLDGLFDVYELGFYYISPVRSLYLLISKISIDQPFRAFMSAMCLPIQMMKITLWLEYLKEETTATTTLSFMGNLQALPNPTATIFLQQAYFTGTTCNVSSGDLGMITIKTFQIFISLNFLFGWKGILMTMAQTVRHNGHQCFWI